MRMGDDLRDQIGQVLSPDVARQLASTVGLDDRQGKTFVDAAVPALLSALASLDGPGAKALSDAVSNADPNMIERLRKALEARDLGPLNDGANALAPVIGAGTRDKIASTLADYLGVPTDATTPALGAIEQVVVAVLGQQDPSVWGDGASLRKYLGDQKAAFAAAVPPALAAAVAPPAPPPPPAPAPAPAAAAARAAPPPPRLAPPPPPQSSGGGAIWIVLVLILIVAAVGGWYWWTQMRPEAKSGSNAPATEFALGAPPELTG
jgi:hypothetical protein